jgi:hypothetical protein
MTDLAQLTAADLLHRLPISWLWWIGGIVSSIFAAGFTLGHWAQSWTLENTKSELALERGQPKTTIEVGAADRDLGDIAHVLRFSFSKPEFIHPEIVEELEGWIADALPVYAAVDLEGAMASNRFVRPVQRRPLPDGTAWILVVKEDETGTLRKPYYMYKFLGVTSSGTHLIQTAGSGGGTGVFGSVLFMRFQADNVLTGTLTSANTRHRVVLRCIGFRLLGDRYDGVVSYADGVLTIGKGTRMDLGREPVAETKMRIE